jgi:hypothetical protein
MRRPRWDIIHPGRSWALPLRAEETDVAIFKEIQRHLAAWPGSA